MPGNSGLAFRLGHDQTMRLWKARADVTSCFAGAEENLLPLTLLALEFLIYGGDVAVGFRDLSILPWGASAEWMGRGQQVPRLRSE